LILPGEKIDNGASYGRGTVRSRTFARFVVGGGERA
jgi:hypothetical protein